MAEPATARNPALLRSVAAYAASVIGEWAMWCGLLVYAFDHGGSTAAGLSSIALLFPAAFSAPAVARLAGGPAPGRVLASVLAVQGTALAVAAGLAVADAGVLAVMPVIAIPVTAQTFIRPCMAVLVPGIVVRPDDLVAANLLTGRADAVSILVGPLLAGALLRAGGPALVFGVGAAIALTGAGLVPVTRHAPATAEGRGSVARVGRAEFAAVLRQLRDRRGTLQVLGVLAAAYALIGALDLLYVNLALDVFRMGDDGSALLSASFGVGAVLGGLATGALLRRRRLAPVVIVALLASAGSLGGLGAVTALGVALVVFPAIGAGRTVLEVTGRLLLQRSAPTDSVAIVFAVLEVSTGLGMLIGSIVAQGLLALTSVSGTLVGLSLVLLVLGVVLVPGLWQADRHADAPIVQTQLLRRVPLLAPLPGPVIERLARGSTLVDIEAGRPVVSEGEVGDSYYVIADGAVDVTIEGTMIRTMRRGEGFGEIALLADVPRTATVTATGPTTVLRIDRTPFLQAVVGHDASAAVAWAVASAWHPPLSDQPE